MLADRIAVGCTLNRGEYNLAWNEVMLPDSDDTVSYILHHIFIVKQTLYLGMNYFMLWNVFCCYNYYFLNRMNIQSSLYIKIT